jgi:hypothetical protein
VFARGCLIVLAAALLGLCGCAGKLEVNKTATVEALDYELIGLPKQSQQQKVTIEVDAPEAVNILVIDASSEKGFDGLAPAKQEALAKYGKKMGVKKDSLSVDVPANATATVAVGGGPKKTEVKISISNRK